MAGKAPDDRAERGKRLALTRSNARLAAVQALYQWEATGTRAESVIKEFADHRLGEVVDDVALPPADLKLFTTVVLGAASNVAELDDMIAAVLTEDWTVERLEATLRAVLRCGVFELAHREDVPPRVVIAEYVGVCDAFFGAKETGLVNGILDQLARQLRPAEMGPGSPRRSLSAAVAGKGKLPGEFDLIARYFAPLAAKAPGALGLKDDAATFQPPAGMELVFTTDALTADLHFLRSDPPDLIARKMLRQNLSDLAGKGAKPLGYLMTTALDDGIDEAWIAKFAEGLAQDQAEFDIALWGGDTTSTPGPLALTATLIGAVPAGRALRRNGARPGDRILVTGTIGDGFFGLAAHRGELPDLAEPARRFLAQRYVLPQPRVALGRMLAEQGLAQAGMDVSDGLAADLAHMCAASHCGARVEVAAVPLSDAVADLVAADPALIASAITGGDDYELVLAVPPDRIAAALDAARQSGTAIVEIGSFVQESRLTFLDRDNRPLAFEKAGFTHF